VPLVEMGFVKGPVTEKVAKEYLKKIKAKNVDVLVLACTHYPLLENVIKRFMGKKVKIINPAEAAAKEIKKFLEKNPEIEKEIKKGGAHEFYFSDKPYNLEKITKLCLNKKINPIIKDPFNGTNL
jgi:glutamate racemase